MTTLSLEIRLLSDWHVGSGWSAPGHVDAVVARDSNGLPFLPAKTIKGIWRDACELVARGLDDGNVGPWTRLVDVIFGSQPGAVDSDPTGYHKDPTNRPLASAVALRPAFLPHRLRQLLLAAPAALQALTFVKPGVKIDPRTGQAEENFLRFEELCRGGISFQTTCELHLPPSVSRHAVALLAAGAQMVQRLGGKRRRGSGRCEFILRQDNKAISLKDYSDVLSTEPPLPSTEGSPQALRRVGSGSGDWTVVDLRLELVTPLVVPARTLGNVVETLDFCPGTFLLPYVARVFHSLGLDPFPAIACGDIRVLNAYIEINGERGLPAPHAVHAVKDSRGYDDPRECLKNRLLSEGARQHQVKAVRSGYVAGTDHGFLGYANVPIEVRTHGTVDDATQRPGVETGGVFSYEAISPRGDRGPVILRSQLLLRSSLAQELSQIDSQWWTRFPDTVQLGRSKSDDYGAAKLEVAPPRDVEPSHFSGTQQDLVVWLVSDALLRDERLGLRPSLDLLRQELERALRVRLRPPARDGGHVFLRMRRIESWQTAWGLPRPSLVGLSAGSCIRFAVDGELDLSRLREVELAGIGLRRGEGFGEVRFNHPLLTVPPAQWELASRVPTVDTRPEPPPLRPDEPGYEYARLIEREAWKTLIARRCLEKAADKGFREKTLGWTTDGGGSPPMTQIMAFRNQVSLIRQPSDSDRVLNWFKRLKESRNRSDKWNNAHGALTKCEQLITDENAVWQALHIDESLPHLTDGAHQLREQLWAYAVRCLVDACARAHKREIEGAT